MGTEEEDQHYRLGRGCVFLGAGLVSALSLAASVHFFRTDDLAFALPLLALSTSLWWPLFKLGRYHAKQRRRMQP